MSWDISINNVGAQTMNHQGKSYDIIAEGFANMLNQELHFYSLALNTYEQYLKKYGFEILLKESDQEQHLVWIAKKNG